MSPVDDTLVDGKVLPGTSKDDILDILNDESDDTPIKETPGDDKEKTEKGEGEEEGEEKLKDIEDELDDEEEKEVDEDELELIAPVRKKEIEKEFPGIFKKFPYLAHAYYRSRAYAEILPTLTDAKEAKEKAITLDNFERSLLSGTVTDVLKAVKESDPKVFNKVVDNYLYNLAQTDERAAHHVIANVHRHTIGRMIQEARRRGNEALESAATIYQQFIFGESEFKPPQRLSNPADDKPNEEVEKLEKEKQQFAETKLNEHIDSLQGKVDNRIGTIIDTNLDPNNSMGDFIKKHAIREIKEDLELVLSRDSHFQTIKDRLWRRAIENNYSRESVDSIQSAYISKAKTVLPSLIKKARKEALKSLGKRTTNDNDDNEPSNKAPVKRGTPATPNKSSNKKVIPPGMSNKDFIMADD